MSFTPPPLPVQRPRVPVEKPVNQTTIINHPPAPKTDFYGVPRLALWIIVINIVLWIPLFGLLLLTDGRPTNTLLTDALLLVASVAFTMVVIFAIWKLFWWFVGCWFSCFTALLFISLVGLLTGAFTWSQIRLPR